MIRDQRTMSGTEPLASAADVRDFWEHYGQSRADQGLDPYPNAPGRRKLAQGRKPVVAYVSDSRWVAECNGGPTGDCRGGIACWPEHEHGCCLDCGTVYPVEFPAAKELAAGLAALEERPEQHRHWRPDLQSAKELRHENIAHGYHPDPQWKARAAAENGIDVATVDRILQARPGRK